MAWPNFANRTIWADNTPGYEMVHAMMPST